MTPYTQEALEITQKYQKVTGPINSFFYESLLDHLKDPRFISRETGGTVRKDLVSVSKSITRIVFWSMWRKDIFQETNLHYNPPYSTIPYLHSVFHHYERLQEVRSFFLDKDFKLL